METLTDFRLLSHESDEFKKVLLQMVLVELKRILYTRLESGGCRTVIRCLTADFCAVS